MVSGAGLALFVLLYIMDVKHTGEKRRQALHSLACKKERQTGTDRGRSERQAERLPLDDSSLARLRLSSALQTFHPLPACMQGDVQRSHGLHVMIRVCVCAATERDSTVKIAGTAAGAGTGPGRGRPAAKRNAPPPTGA